MKNPHYLGLHIARTMQRTRLYGIEPLRNGWVPVAFAIIISTFLIGYFLGGR